jgi:hypothetical protein
LFEAEKSAFENGMNKFYSGDSGFGTDYSSSSLSDSELDFQERSLLALKKRAEEIQAVLPNGCDRLVGVIEKV